MPEELESKVKVGDHDAVRARLKSAGAEYLGRVLETNRIFDDKAGSLLASGCGLRVRECHVLDGIDRPATLTYKGPVRDGVFKRRTEIEVAIDDAGAMTEILAGLEFSPRIVFEKRRESWRLKGCEVELDEVPGLGLFVEVEGPNEEAIQGTMSWLGLDSHDSIRSSYIAMLMKDAIGAGPFEFRF